MFFKQADLGVAGEEQGFTIFAPRGRGTKGPRLDVFQTQVPKSLTGLGGFTKRVSTTLSLPKSSTRPTSILSGPSAFASIRESPGAFTGLGLFERTSAVSAPIGRGPSQTLITSGTTLVSPSSTLISTGRTLTGPRSRDDFIFKPLVGTRTGLAQPTSQRPSTITGLGVTPRLADIQLQPQILRTAQPPPTVTEFAPQLSIFEQPTRRPTPPIRRPTQRFRDPFFPIGFPTVLGGRGRRARRTKRKPARRTPLQPSFTAIIADVRGPLPTELSVGGFNVGVLPGQIRRIPRRRKGSKVRKPTRKKRTKKRR